MKSVKVEIFSDSPNRAVIRHPSRRYPGVLIQGDDLFGLCLCVDKLSKSSLAAERDALSFDDQMCLSRLRESLWDYFEHYSEVLAQHGAPVPFGRMESPLSPSRGNER
jgi:hypothetical protein